MADDYQGSYSGVDEFTGQPAPDPTGQYSGGDKNQPPTPKEVAPSPGATTKPDYSQSSPESGKDPMQQLIDQGQDIQRRIQQNNEDQMRTMNRLFQAQNQEIEQQMRNRPQMPEMPQMMQPPTPDQKQAGKNLIAYFAIALPLALLMGARGGPFAGGAIGGFGAGLAALRRGEDDAAERNFSRAAAINQLAGIQYNRQMQMYKEIINTQNMDLNMMMSQIENVSRMYANKDVALAAEEKNWDKTMTELQKRHDAMEKNVERQRRLQKSYEPRWWNDYAHTFFERHKWYPDFADAHDPNLDPKKRKDLEGDTYQKWLEKHQGKLDDLDIQSKEQEEKYKNADDNLGLFKDIGGEDVTD